MIVEIAILLFGLVLLVKGSGYFVRAASLVAESFGISEFVIGLTLVAGGTSLPELVSAIVASSKGESSLIIGTIVGANVANICLILGIAACVRAIATNREMLYRDAYIMFTAFVITLIFTITEGIGRAESAVLLLLFVAYTVFILESKPRVQGLKEFLQYFISFSYLRTMMNISMPKTTKKESLWKNILIIITSCCVIIFGAQLVVKQAVFLAALFNVPTMAIGILIAIGTTMPEMSVAIAAARQGLGKLILGNVIGSCITNTLLIFGVAGIINPLTVSQVSRSFAIPFMVGVGALAIFFIRSGWEINKKQGISLIGAYGVFLVMTYVLL